MSDISLVRRVALVVNKTKPDAINIAHDIERHLDSLSIETIWYNSGDDVSTIDLAISLGGDGTLLVAAQDFTGTNIGVMPVNLGRLGFIAVISPDNWRSCFESVLAGRAVCSRRLLLEVKNGDEVFYALNDVVVNCEELARLVKLRLRIGENEFRLDGDGVIIATPTGSTAYSLAAGGPIIDPEMEVIQVTPISPFTLANRPMVVDPFVQIGVRADDECRYRLNMTVDGQTNIPLQSGQQITVRRARKQMTLWLPSDYDYYRWVEEKLRWSGGR